MNNLPLRALLFLVWLVACMPALAQTTVTLQQGLNSYTGTTDTWLWSGGPDINHGGEDEWQMRFNTTTATLLRFAIFQAEGGPVPNGATITAATLSVYKHTGATSGTYNAQRLLRPWVESQATWNSASSGSPWESGGAQGASDVTTAGEAQVTMGVELGWLNYDVLAIAQAWAGGAPNHGFRMRQISGENQPHYFYAKERAIPQEGLRPSLTITYTTPTGCTSGAFGGTPWPVGEIEAENFDCGGEGVGYHDLTAGNQMGSTYRPGESVDVWDMPGGGQTVRNFDTGEWMQYTISVPAGSYNLAISAAHNATPGQYRIEIDGNDVTGNVTVPGTGSWDAYQWVQAPSAVTLSAGTHVVRLVSAQQSYRVDKIRLEAATPASCEAPPQRPFTGSAIQVPLGGVTFEAEDYDCGGENVAYHDTTAGNQLGSLYRPDESTDIWDMPGGGQVVRNFDTGEWMEYTINVLNAGSYRLGIMAGHNATPGLYRIDVDGVDATGNVTVPGTGSWDVYQWVDSPNTVNLTAGTHVLRLFSVQQSYRVEKVRVMPAGGTTTVDSADILAQPRADIPFAGQSQALGGFVQAYGSSRALNQVAEPGGVTGTNTTQYGNMRFGKQTNPANANQQVFTFMVAPGDPNTSGSRRGEFAFDSTVEWNKIYWVAVRVYVYDWGTAGAGANNDDALFGTQLHSGDNSLGLSPSFGIYEENGRQLRIHARTHNNLSLPPAQNNQKTTKYPLAGPIDLPFGEWVEFVFKFRHSLTNGFMQAWMNGTLIADHQGAFGFDSGMNDYVKYGYYNWVNANFDASGVPRKVLLHSPLLIKGFDTSSSDKYTLGDVRTYLNQRP
jgi:hypothetical protein